MSLVSIIGPRPNLFDLEGTVEDQAAGSAPADPHQCRPGEDPLDLRDERRSLQVAHLRHHLPGRAWRRRHGLGDRRSCASAPRKRCATAATSSSCPTARPAPTAFRSRSLLACAAVHHHLIRNGLAHLGRPGAGDRRAARGASFRVPGRLRRGSDQSLSRLRDADRHEGRSAAKARRKGNHQALHQVDRQRPAQGDVQDGHLHLSVLLRRADFRRGRPAPGLRRQVFHRHAHPHRGRGVGRDRGRGGAPPPRRVQRFADLPHRCSTSAAIMPCACAARTMSGPPRRCRGCSTPCAAIRRSTTAPSPRS